MSGRKGMGHEHHGMYGTKLYSTWSNMKLRCGAFDSPAARRSRGWKHYGGKGVTVCAEWAASFTAFWFWAVLTGYREGLTIDRIDPRRGYCPENCQWLTRGENSRKANLARWKKWRRRRRGGRR